MLMLTLDELLDKTYRLIATRRRFPVSTYRLQFHAGFTFRDATTIVPYLHDLGVTHCYASPYLKARPGSQHGYDIIDHRSLNPEIGTEDDYQAWVEALHSHNMGQILDMVPNHMGIVGNENLWWNDVLENGPSSPYAGYFDIAWQDASRPELLNRVLLPVLGDPYGKVLEAGQIRLAYDSGSFTIHYFDHRFPVAPNGYARILSQDLAGLEARLGPDAAPLNEYKSILTALSHLPDRNETDTHKVAERQREKEIIKRRLATVARESVEVRESLESTVERFNGTPGDAHSFDLLDELLNGQAYRLSDWRVAADEINYRRFFDINELAALSMEKLDVFTAAHQLVLRFLGRGELDGLRIDHPDGLFDPRQYLERLQQYYVLACARSVYDSEEQASDTQWKDLEGPLLEKIAESFRQDKTFLPLYVVVEKILGGNENLPADWKTHGTSGYDFVNVINDLFVDPSGEEALTRLYEHHTGENVRFGEVVYRTKYQVLRDALSSELHMLGRQLDRLAQKNRWSRDFTRYTLRFALGQVIACFPVYRSYIAEEGVHDSDRKYVENAVVRAMRRNPTVSRSLFRFVRDMLLLRYPEPASESDRAEQRRFTGKFQQVTGPVMAKGVEDTAFYVYHRLLSLNEVGGDPSQFGLKPEAVHRFNQARQARWPYALSPLSTHDTKRSEDVRARLNVLSELPAEWAEGVGRWTRLNESHRGRVDDEPVPDDNEEYLIYQTLVGAWPLEPYTPGEYTQFIERVQEYVTKSLHEAKVHTSWINPDEAYDEAVRKFVALILDDKVSGKFLRDFREFRARVNHVGLLNSLAQTLLRITSPGAPDTYQGTELWDFSLVDPDNRRPVDYRRRAEMLRVLDARLVDSGAERLSLARELIRSKENGRVKLFVTAQALRLRRDHPDLFSTGEYLPAEIMGVQREHVFGFTRRSGNDVGVILVPRLAARLGGPDGLPLGRAVWQDTRVVLPEQISDVRWRNLFTGQVVTATEDQGRLVLALDEAFADFPLALLTSLQDSQPISVVG
jgi:(1->4)-alpha-D-glucan 1-alpha-D-glucosylmutase